MSNLPEHGVRVVAKGAPEAIKQLSAFDKAVQASNKGLALASKANTWKFPELPKGGSGLQGIGKYTSALQTLNQVTQGLVPGLGTATNGLAAFGAGTGAVAAPVALAAAAVTGLGIAFVNLGKYGASLTPTLQAFGNITGSAGDSTSALQALREQTRGTISDFELMRLATASLQGTTKEFRSIVQEDLGTIIDFTSRVAQATGQSAEVVREKFILGLRRQSRLLLDDVGVVVDKTSARFKELRETMTDDAAYAALAIEKLKEVGSELGAPNTVMENITAGFVFFRNTLDKMAVAIQPAFAPFTEASARIREQFAYLVEVLFPPFVAAAQFAGNVLSTAFSAAEAAIKLFMPQLGLLGEILPYLAALGQIAFETLSKGVSAFGSLVGQISTMVSAAVGDMGMNVKVNIDQLAYDVGEGGGRIIGAFAAGLAKGGTYVVKAVTKIAQIVADFLQGFSPPKVGPLSQIDQGGYNVAKAWADGFTKGFMNPVEQVAAGVEARLGEIGTFTAAQVSTRLATLDSALQPFIDQLDIAKADLESIAGFVDPALQAIERQRTAALEAFTGGGGDVNALRGLDAQFEALDDFKDAQQSITDEAEIQLALAKAQQAQERALLAIQQRRVGAVQEATSGGGASDALERAKAAASGGGGGGAPAEASGGGGFAPGALPDIFSSEAVEKARQRIEQVAAAGGKGFQAGVDDSGADEAIAALSAQAGELQTQLGRIRDANPVEKLKSKFEGLETVLDDPLGAMRSKVSAAVLEIMAAFTPLTTLNLSALGDVANAPLETLNTKFLATFGPEGTIGMTIGTLFGPGGALSPTGLVGTAINGLFGPEGTVTVALNNLGSVVNIITSTIKSTLENFATSGLTGALMALPQTLLTAFTDPFIKAAEAAIKSVDDIIPNEISFHLGSVSLPVLVNPFGILPDYVTFEFGNATMDLPDNPFQAATARAKGGVGRGLTWVGEEGPELINLKQPTNIFPADVSRAIMSMASNQFRPMAGGGDTNNSTSYSTTQNTTTINVKGLREAIVLRRQQLARSF